MVSILSLTKYLSFSHRGPFFLSQRTFLFLTEKHRRTEHTKAHRDIKSTDNTERYSQQKPHPQPLSEWRGE